MLVLVAREDEDELEMVGGCGGVGLEPHALRGEGSLSPARWACAIGKSVYPNRILRLLLPLLLPCMHQMHLLPRSLLPRPNNFKTLANPPLTDKPNLPEATQTNG